MAEKKITRKVISKVSEQDGEIQKEVSLRTPRGDAGEGGSPREATPKVGEAGRTKKVCFFCQSKTNPSYTDTSVLRRFVTDRTKIVPKSKSNLCSKHQRFVTRQIKYARHLALLPFTPKV